MKSASLPPGPTPHAPLGHLFAIRRDILGFLTNLAREYEDIASVKIGPMRIVLVNHPDYIREILVTNPQGFVKGRPLKMAKHLLGEGLLTSEGESHKRQRLVVQQAFRPECMAGYGSVMTEHATRVSTGWSDGAVVDMVQEMTRMAIGIAGETLFHWDIESDEAAGISRALDDAMGLFTRVAIPFSEWLLRLPLPSTFLFKRARTHLHSAIRQVIEERRRQGVGARDLLSMLLLAQNVGVDGLPVTDNQVRDEALTLFLTAFDTTSLALTWTWYLISQHEPVERKLHSELDRVLGGRSPTADDMERLPYTRMVFSESMRLYPPLYAIARQALQACVIGRYTVPAGTLLLMSPYVMHRDPRYYPNPLQFDPERWNSERRAKLPAFTYFPFGGGPRRCIGESFAWLEGILVIATLAQHWRIHLVPRHPVALRPLINLRPKFGMRMVLERRT